MHENIWNATGFGKAILEIIPEVSVILLSKIQMLKSRKTFQRTIKELCCTIITIWPWGKFNFHNFLNKIIYETIVKIGNII